MKTGTEYGSSRDITHLKLYSVFIKLLYSTLLRLIEFWQLEGKHGQEGQAETAY
jgi:hypothetical protein